MIFDELSSKAYYKNKSGIILNMDCVEAMKLMPNECIDLTVTSPPYDNLRTYEGFNWDFKTTAKELYHITKQGGVVVWIVGDSTINGSETGTSFKQALYFKEIGFNLHDTMIYMKDNPPPTGGNTRYFQSFEYMFVISKDKPKTFNPIVEPRRNKWNDKRTVRNRPVTRNKAGTFTTKTVPINQDMVKLQNVWSYVVSGGSVASDKIAHKHPAIFPEPLIRDHIISWSNENDIVFDPFMGSGTTAKMAMLNNRKFIGCEISEKYCKIIKERLDNVERI